MYYVQDPDLRPYAMETPDGMALTVLCAIEAAWLDKVYIEFVRFCDIVDRVRHVYFMPVVNLKML